MFGIDEMLVRLAECKVGELNTTGKESWKEGVMVEQILWTGMLVIYVH